MKKAFFKISAFVLLFALVGAGCEKDEDSITDLTIFKELPILYMGYNLENEETRVIKNQETLEIIFSKDLIAQITTLQNIDFSKYDVLVGENSYRRGIAKLEHKFIKTGNHTYSYKLDVFHDLTLPAGRFCYGIIVNKLPMEAVVNFEVTKINE
jgi:hypothetical protein